MPTLKKKDVVKTWQAKMLLLTLIYCRIICHHKLYSKLQVNWQHADRHFTTEENTTQ